MGKIKVGDRVEIVYDGLEYSTYHSWFRDFAPTLLGFYAPGSIRQGERGIVVEVHKHHTTQNNVLAIKKGNNIVLFGEEGVKVVEPCSEVIVVYSRGKETIAEYKQGKKIIKKAKARCNPIDEFKFEIGARLAIDRLLGLEHEIIEVRRLPRVGELIKITRTDDSRWSVGDVFVVGKVHWDDVYIEHEDGYSAELSGNGKRMAFLDRSEYVVLETCALNAHNKPLSSYTNQELAEELLRRVSE